MNIFIANVPPWYPNQPYLSIPLLTGIMRDAGHTVIQKDLNLDFYHFLFNEENLLELKKQLSLLDLTQLNSAELELYEVSGFLLENIHENLSIFKSNEFYDKDSFKSSLEVIELTLKIYSLIYKDTKVYLGDIIYNFNSLNLLEIFNFINGDNIFTSFFERKVMNEVNIQKLDLFALSVTTSQQLIPAFFICKQVKELFPNVKILIGGDIITRLKSELMEMDIVWDWIDYIMYSYGEVALVNLLETIESGGELKQVPNLIYKEENKRIITKESKEFNINTIPYPDYDGLELDNYFSPEIILPIEFSKGCYWGKCTFCEIVGLPYKVKNADRMYQEMEYFFDKYNVRFFTIVDSASPPGKLRQLSEIINENEKPMYWRTMIKAEKYFDENVSTKLFNGGCRLVMIGIESGNQRVLNLMDKGVLVDDVRMTIRNLHNAGIWVHNFYMFGFPTETEAEALETLEFIDENASSISSISASTFILPNYSPIYQQPSKYKIDEISKNAYNNLAIHNTKMSGEFLSDEQLSNIDVKFSKLIDSYKHLSEYDDIHLNYYFLHKVKTNGC